MDSQTVKGLVYLFVTIIGILVYLVYNYSRMVNVVVSWNKEPVVMKVKGKRKSVQPPPTSEERIKSLIPWFQVAYVKEVVFGRATLAKVAAVFVTVSEIANLFVTFILPESAQIPLFLLICHMLAIAGVIVAKLLYGIVTARIAYLYSFSKFTTVLCFLFPCLTCGYLKNNIPAIMNELNKGSTFEEHTADTQIKKKKTSKADVL